MDSTRFVRTQLPSEIGATSGVQDTIFDGFLEMPAEVQTSAGIDWFRHLELEHGCRLPRTYRARSSSLIIRLERPPSPSCQHEQPARLSCVRHSMSYHPRVADPVRRRHQHAARLDVNAPELAGWLLPVQGAAVRFSTPTPEESFKLPTATSRPAAPRCPGSSTVGIPRLSSTGPDSPRNPRRQKCGIWHTSRTSQKYLNCLGERAVHAEDLKSGYGA